MVLVGLGCLVWTYLPSRRRRFAQRVCCALFAALLRSVRGCAWRAALLPRRRVRARASFGYFFHYYNASITSARTRAPSRGAQRVLPACLYARSTLCGLAQHCARARIWRVTLTAARVALPSYVNAALYLAARTPANARWRVALLRALFAGAARAPQLTG